MSTKFKNNGKRVSGKKPKRPEGSVIFLDPELLAWPERYQKIKDDILKKTVISEDRNTLRELNDYAEDSAICDDIQGEFETTEEFTRRRAQYEMDTIKCGKEEKELFDNIILAKRVSLAGDRKKRGKNGGSKDKVRIPFMLAIQIIKENNPNILKLTNSKMTEYLLNTLSDNDVYIEYNRAEWRVYSLPDDRLFFAEPDPPSNKNRNISVKFDTIRKKYIPKIKKVGT